MKEETSEDILLEEIESRISEVTKISRDIYSSLDESSPEARLKRIRGLSTDYIPGLMIELWRRIDKESSEEKKKKMWQIQEELSIEYLH